MAHEIVMPQLNLSMDKGQIVKWLKQDGDIVKARDFLLEVESDKAVVEVEAVESGILQIVMGPESGEIAVGVVIAYFRAENEAPVVKTAPILAAVNQVTANANITASAPVTSSGQKQRRLPSSPAARRKAAELRIDWQQATGTGRGGRIKERDVLRFVQEMNQTAGHKTSPAVAIQLTPLARRIADDFGVQDELLGELFPGKTKFEREDVENAIRQVVRERQIAPTIRTVSTSAVKTADTAPRRVAIGALRRRIAERMRLSVETYAPVTLTTEIDATELVRLRERLKSDMQKTAGPSYNALLTKITAQALREVPELNASLEAGEIVYWSMVNIGVAVDTERGLVVPVVRDVAAKSVTDLANEMNDLIGRAAQGKATPEELTGGTFTITNLGVNDIDAFTPIINPPEFAVLGIGRLRKQMVVIDDQPAVRTMLVLSLTFDHRLVDGAPAARSNALNSSASSRICGYDDLSFFSGSGGARYRRAARGIGYEIAVELGEAGARLAVLDVRTAEALSAAQRLRQAGHEAIGLGADVARGDEVKTAVQAVIEQWGRLDILVNNAGICPLTPFADISEAEWDLVLGVNLKGMFLCSQAAAPCMRQHQYGRIVNIASSAGQMGGLAVGLHYATSKAGVFGLTKSLARILAPDIHVNAVAPGTTETDMIQGWNQNAVANIINQIPLKRLGQTTDVAGAVLFLVSPQAAFMTGQTISVNGGLFMP